MIEFHETGVYSRNTGCWHLFIWLTPIPIADIAHNESNYKDIEFNPLIRVKDKCPLIGFLLSERTCSYL